ncbi:MAG TPA: hypothetical protein VEX42_09755 [Microbacterium sp.]|nr:hypothetical protein [Microbacterium sp.]
MTKTWLSGQRRIAVMAAVTALMGVLIPTGAAVAEDVPPVMYERTAYDGTIWEVTATGAYALSYSEWSSRDFPAFTDADTEYVRAAPFNTVYAITTFELAQTEWTDHIDYAQYVAAGQPRPTVVPWVEGIEVHKWPTSSELFGTDSAGATVRLSYAQWSAAGFPAFHARENRGFVAMTWDGSGAIAYMCDLAAGRGGRLTYDQWRSIGSPTPLRVNRTASDFVFKVPGSVIPTVYYSGPVISPYAPAPGPVGLGVRPLTYTEWQGMGSPVPLITNTTYPGNWYCSGSHPGPQE